MCGASGLKDTSKKERPSTKPHDATSTRAGRSVPRVTFALAPASLSLACGGVLTPIGALTVSFAQPLWPCVVSSGRQIIFPGTGPIVNRARPAVNNMWDQALTYMAALLDQLADETAAEQGQHGESIEGSQVRTPRSNPRSTLRTGVTPGVTPGVTSGQE